MLKRAFLALAFLAVPAAAFAQGTIEGRVTSASGAGLSGARVAIPALDISVGSGPGGAYSISGVPAGDHEVEVRIIGYAIQTRTVSVASGQTANQDFALELQAINLGELVVVGSRAQPRTVTESMVPVDVIPVSEITSQAETNIDFLLRTVVPSYNVRVEPISDAATITRPANLRGLASDHTMVLINGKRRHRGSIITWLGAGLSDGAQGVDIGAIPGIALRQVEVLRDGASAQYGSDAIAGVMNFILKDDRDGGMIEVKSGSYYEGDGDMLTVSGNVGVPLGATGFANLSVEYGNQDPTDRAIQRGDAIGLIAAGNSAVRTPTAQIWGSPEVTDDLKVWLNTGYTFNDDEQFYAFGNLATKEVDGGFFFRNPNTRGGVFSGDGGETLLVGDVLKAKGLGSANCPVVTITNNVPDPAALAQVFADPNCFSFQEMFPGGFTPQFGGNVTDWSVVGGVKGGNDSGFTWDASASFGSHTADFFIYNTVNAALGPETPTHFDPGLYTQDELHLNFDVAYEASDQVHLAGGLERREERFLIGQGQDESWRIGPYAAQGFSSSSNGFPGFSPIAAGEWDRQNVAIYGDLHGEGLGSSRGQRAARPARRREHRLPRADAGAAERLQRVDGVRRDDRRPRQPRHDPVDVGGGGAAGRRAAASREGVQPHRGDRVRCGRVQADDGLLPDRDFGPLRADADLQSHRRRGHATAGRGNHERGEPRRVPVLHQRLQHEDAGDRHRGELHAPVDGRRDELQRALQLQRHDGHRLQPRRHRHGSGGPAREVRPLVAGLAQRGAHDRRGARPPARDLGRFVGGRRWRGDRRRGGHGLPRPVPRRFGIVDGPHG